MTIPVIYFMMFLYTPHLIAVDRQKQDKEYEKDCPRCTLVIHFNYVCLSEHCCFYKKKKKSNIYALGFRVPFPIENLISFINGHLANLIIDLSFTRVIVVCVSVCA